MNHPRRSLRLSELMLIVGIVGILCGVIVRGSVIAREAGRRLQCQNNMRQIGLGLSVLVNTKGSFPNAGTIADDPQIHQGDPARSNIYRVIFKMENRSQTADVLLHSWVVDVSPFFDIQCFYNVWDTSKSYLEKEKKKQIVQCVDESSTVEIANSELASTSLGILRCPSDFTGQPNQGNLSYVVNGGFSRWPALPVRWSGGLGDDRSKPKEILHWAGPEGTWQENQAIGRKLGVMFLGTPSRDQSWDVKTTLGDIVDGAAQTILLGENTLTGYSPGTPYSGGLPTNWACPLPNFCMFFGSDDVCRTSNSATDCLGGQLQPTPQGGTGQGWSRSNSSDARVSRNPAVEGSFPFANSGHRGGSNFGFCDGSVRFLGGTIDGKVYAELITPAGTALPSSLRQGQTTSESY